MDVNCDVCGAKAELVDNSVIYGRSYGKVSTMWLCPKCSAYVGTHPNLAPLGSLVGPEVREMRKVAHQLFDPLWTGSRAMFDSRGAAYRWLDKAMGMERGKAHIGSMSAEQCTAVKDAILNLRMQGDQNNETEVGSKEE